MASSIERIAKAARDNLQSSLAVTHHLTASSGVPADRLMHRMNGVLRAVIDTNFNPSALAQLGELYATIAEEQPAMVDSPHNLALVNLSRTVAVVLEESIRARAPNNNNSSSSSNYNNSSSSNNNATAAAGGYATRRGTGDREAGNGGAAPRAPPMTGYGRPMRLLDPDYRGMAGFGPSGGNGGGHAPSARPQHATSYNADAARAAAREDRRDYSATAIEGRITVFNIPIAVTEVQLTAHFKDFGEIKYFSYPHGSDGKRRGFALLKFKDNKTADLAVAQLNGKQLGGAPLSIDRARFWFKEPPRPTVADITRRVASDAFTVNAPASQEEEEDDEEEDESDEDESDSEEHSVYSDESVH